MFFLEVMLLGDQDQERRMRTEDDVRSARGGAMPISLVATVRARLQLAETGKWQLLARQHLQRMRTRRDEGDLKATVSGQKPGGSKAAATKTACSHSLY